MNAFPFSEHVSVCCTPPTVHNGLAIHRQDQGGQIGRIFRLLGDCLLCIIFFYKILKYIAQILELHFTTVDVMQKFRRT
jgi:hypothetical protein